MAKHEFGIMFNTPGNERYDKRQYKNVINLFEQAASDNKYIIHYGL